MTSTYRRIAADVRREIEGGAAVPGVSELARRYEVTRPTARNAIRLLEAEGLLTADRRALGRKPITLRLSDEETITFIEDMARGGHVVAPPDIKVHIEGEYLVREVLRVVDGEPHNWARWRFPLDREGVLGSRLAYDTDIPEGSVRYLKEGLEWTGLVQDKPWIEGRPATPEEAAILRPPPGWNVFVEHRRGTGQSTGVLMFKAKRILRMDRTRLIP